MVISDDKKQSLAHYSSVMYKEVRVLTALAKGSHSKPLYLFLWDGKNAWEKKTKGTWTVDCFMP
jgi:hypothetical protein